MRKYQAYYCLIAFIILCSLSKIEAAIAVDADWQCVVMDKTDKKWVGFASFERNAKQKALDACKKNSLYPKTCIRVDPCFSPQHPQGPAGLWICTALDRNGEAWTSNGAPDKWSAALAARAYCRDKSTIPHTCYINTVTCRKRGL